MTTLNASRLLKNNYPAIEKETKLDELMVSTLSRFTDNKWDYNEQENNPSSKPSGKIIYWDKKLPDDSFLIDPQHAPLLLSCKRFLYEQHRNGNSGKPISAATLRRVFTNLMPFVRFMVSKNLASFTSVTRWYFDQYRMIVRTKTNKQGNPISPQSAFGLLNVLSKIYELREKLDDSFTINPLSDSTAFEEANLSKRKLSASKWKHIPDDIAKDLASKAVSLINNAEEAVDLWNISFAPKTIKGGTSRSALQRARRSLIAESNYEHFQALTSEIGSIRAACFIVIAFFTGARLSENTAFTSDCLDIDEETGIYWLHGRKFKLGRSTVKWMAPPIVKRALEIATLISQPYKIKLLQEKERLLNTPPLDATPESITKRLQEIKLIETSLFLTEGSRTKPTLGGTRVSVYTSFHESLKSFMVNMKIKQHNGETWNLHPHQFRYTFARFMAANLMNLRYLQEHFKHLSLDMTAWYDVDDVELTETIVTYYKEFKKNVLSEVMESGVVAGKAAGELKKERKHIFLGLTSQTAKDDFIAELADDVTMKSTGHSFCLGNSDKALCTGVVGCLFDPSKVLECGNAFTVQSHIDAWKDNQIRCETLLENDDIGEAEKAIQRELLEKTIKPIIKELESE